MRFFFYGTLMDCDLLSLVLGRPVDQSALKPALLRGYRRSALQGLDYPVILPEPSAWVRGVILDGASEVDCDRLRRYEGADYVLMRGVAELPLGLPQSVLYFEPRPDAFVATGKPWSLARWRLRVKPSELRRLGLRATTAIAPFRSLCKGALVSPVRWKRQFLTAAFAIWRWRGCPD